MTPQRYGVTYPSYWSGDTGRAIQTAGGTPATLLGLYLQSTRYANLTGLYYLTTPAILRDTPLGPTDVADAFDVLARAGFASYHAATASVWVPNLLRYRLPLAPGAQLELTDPRRPMLQRLLTTCGPIVENVFYPQFLHRYAGPLQINRWGIKLDPVYILRSKLGALKEVHQVHVQQEETEGMGKTEGKRPTTSRALYRLIAEEAIDKTRTDGAPLLLPALCATFKRICTMRHLDASGTIAADAIADALVAARDRR